MELSIRKVAQIILMGHEMTGPRANCALSSTG
jgi:hypothetical protein